MRHALLLSAAPILLGLAILPAEAHGGGSGGGHGVGFSAPAFHLGVNHTARRMVAQQPRNQLTIRRNRLNAGRFPGQHFAHSFVGGVLGGWAWPDAGTVQVTMPEPIQPQVIVIDPSNGHAAQRDRDDYSYVTGCRPIPNGYHCDVQ